MPNPRNDRFEFIGTGEGPDCTIGELTRFAIQNIEGWDQGDHAANQMNPRAGLANVDFALLGGDERGDIFATCDFVAGMIGYPPEDDMM